MIERKTFTSRDEWLEWRKQDVTASSIGALFNCHPYTTALRLYAEKRGTDFLVEDNKAMRRGRWLEPAVAGDLGWPEPGVVGAWGGGACDDVPAMAEHWRRRLRSGGTPAGVSGVRMLRLGGSIA